MNGGQDHFAKEIFRKLIYIFLLFYLSNRHRSYLAQLFQSAMTLDFCRKTDYFKPLSLSLFPSLFLSISIDGQFNRLGELAVVTREKERNYRVIQRRVERSLAGKSRGDNVL